MELDIIYLCTGQLQVQFQVQVTRGVYFSFCGGDNQGKNQLLILVLSSSLQFNFSLIIVQFRYDFGLEVHLITYIGLHFLGFSWSKAQRKGMP
jgi:hypothetical protein